MTKNYWEGKSIRLRAIEEGDVTRIVESRNSINNENQWYYDKIMLPESEAAMKKFCDEVLAEQKKDDKYFFIIETLNGSFVGHIYVWHTQRREGVFKYGILVDDVHKGKGYAKEALIIVLDYYFNELNYQKCNPTVYEFNTRSQAFHEKFGFVREGVLRNEVYTRGQYFSMVCYGMLKVEFGTLYGHFGELLCKVTI